MGKIPEIEKISELYILSHDLSREYAGQLRARAARFARACPKTCDEITEEDVSAWLASLQATEQLSHYTLCGYRANVLALLQYAADLGFRPYLQMRRVRKIKRPQCTPAGWSLEEVRRLVLACGKMPGDNGNGLPLAVWLDILCRLGWDTGLRLGDVLRLQRQDVATEPRSVRQHKTGRVHIISCSQSTVSAVEASYPPERDAVLPWYRSRRELHRRITQLVERAGLKGTYKYLRRSGASLVEAAGGSGRDFLGHASVGVYEGHYRVAQLAGVGTVRPPEI